MMCDLGKIVARGKSWQIALLDDNDEVAGFEFESDHNRVSKRRRRIAHTKTNPTERASRSNVLGHIFVVVVIVGAHVEPGAKEIDRGLPIYRQRFRVWEVEKQGTNLDNAAEFLSCLRIDEVQLKDRLADGMGRVCGHLEDFIRRGFTR